MKIKPSLIYCFLLTVFLWVNPTVLFSSENTFQDNFLNPEYSKTISMDFKGAVLNDVLKIFSQQSGLNFIAAETIADKKVTLYLDKVPVEEALERILSANNLTYEIQPGSNIFVVKEFKKPLDVISRVYFLKYATIESSKINSTITISDPDSSQSSQSSNQSSSQSTKPGASSSSSETGIVAALNTVITKSGSIVQDPRTNSITVTDIPSQFPLIEQTIARLDVPIPQILIETEMLDISKETADLLGVKIGSTPLTFKGAERDVLYPWNQNRILDKGGFTFGGSEYRAGTISAAGLTAALQFLRTRTDTRNLARPRILTLNNETAQIKISTNEAIGIGTTTSSAQNIAQSTSQAERVQTGVFLTVTPQANLTTKEITMAIVPKVIQARAGGTFEGKTFKDPEERGSKSILRIRDGETIMLGGLLRTDYSNTITKVPVLGDLPFIGAAFRHKDKSEKERELVIFITPHIASDKATSELALKPAERLLREQEIPSGRLKAIDKAMQSIESQKR